MSENASNTVKALGKIAGIQGEVILVGPNGEEVVGKAGHELHMGSVIKTLGSSIVVISLEGYAPISLGHDKTLTISQDLIDSLSDVIDGSIGDDVNFELLTQAVESGESIEELLPATAAGGESVPGSAGSSVGSGARIELTADTVSPVSGFETSGLSSVSTVTFINNPEFYNSQPYTTGLLDIAVDEDVNVSIDLSLSFFDDDAGQTLSFTIDELPDGLVFDPQTGTISGAATNDAAFSQLDGYVLAVTATDDSGADNNSVTTSFTLLVNNINDAPFIGAPIELGSIEEDNGITIASETLLDGADDIDLFDILSVDSVTISGGEGDVINNGDGTFSYVPSDNWFGDAEFTYVISDGEGGTVENTGNLSISPVNDAPEVVAIDLGSVVEDGSVAITEAELLAGATDIEGDSLSVENLVLASGQGVLSSTGPGTWSFAPAANWNGDVSFDFDVNDGTDSTANSAALTVTAENDAPEVVAIDLGSVVEDGSLLIQQSDLLVGATDPESDPLFADDLSITSGDGVLTDLGNGSWTFEPTEDWSGTATFSFWVNDGDPALPVQNTASLVVAAAADAPSIVLDDATENNGEQELSLPVSTGLLLSFFDNLNNLDNDAALQEGVIDLASATSAQRIIDGLGTPDEVINTDVIPSNGSTIEIGTRDSYAVTGLIFLEAGSTYEFQGYRDDSMRVELGGETIISTTGDSWGNFGPNVVNPVVPITQEAFTAPATGFYSIEVYVNNINSLGQFSLNMVVDGGDAQELNAANFHIYSSVEDLVSVGGQIGSFVPGSDNIDGGYYPSQIGRGAENTYIEISNIEALSTDDDGSENIVSVVISGIPVGANLTDGENEFLGTIGQDAIDVLGEGWDLTNIQIRPPAGFVGDFNLTVTATSEESSNADQAFSSETILISVDDLSDFSDGIDPDLVNTDDTLFGTVSGDTLTGTADDDLIVADAGDDQVSGLAGNDILDGGSGADTLDGGAGNDLLFGAHGADILVGGEGEDIIFGGRGADSLTGGDDSDIFVWNSTDDVGNDVVTDFTDGAGGDVLDISDLLQGESDDAAVLDNYLSFSSDGTDTTISVDVDGDGVATDMSIVLEGIDLTLLGADQAIIQNLLDNGNLITD
ncbi:MAG: retention module-containing protein [Agarilytica sp.]